jgi:hypothetical protein
VLSEIEAAVSDHVVGAGIGRIEISFLQRDDRAVENTGTDFRIAPQPHATGRTDDDRDEIGDAIGSVVGDLVRNERLNRERAVAELERQVDRLEGQIAALLSLLQGKAADVVQLPRKHG